MTRCPYSWGLDERHLRCVFDEGTYLVASKSPVPFLLASTVNQPAESTARSAEASRLPVE